jgi:hypothetical protein
VYGYASRSPVCPDMDCEAIRQLKIESYLHVICARAVEVPAGGQLGGPVPRGRRGSGGEVVGRGSTCELASLPVRHGHRLLAMPEDLLNPEDCLRSWAAEALLWAPHRPLVPESPGLMAVANAFVMLGLLPEPRAETVLTDHKSALERMDFGNTWGSRRAS